MPGDNQGLTEMTNRDPGSGMGLTCGKDTASRGDSRCKGLEVGNMPISIKTRSAGQGHGQSGGTSCGPWRPRHRFFFDSGEQNSH